MQSYRKDLLESYARTHADALDGDLGRRQEWFRGHVRRNYAPVLPSADEVNVLEIGCGKGLLLKALMEQGYHNLWGVDLSPSDLAIARQMLPGAEFAQEDANSYLRQREGCFDVVIAKAIVEHIPKDEVIPLFRTMHASLRDGGVALVEVPNMDWLFATHERYMDFTHEVGFTSESLLQTMNQAFEKVSITAIDHIYPRSILGSVAKRLSRTILGTLLRLADYEGGSGPIWCRSILGVGVKMRSRTATDSSHDA